MGTTRKRSRSEAVAVSKPEENEEPGLLQRIRSCWEFASLMQYIAIFGKVVKIDEDLEIEDLEDECMKPEPSLRLLDIGLCLLKWISSHRGLTFENFDEYTRRQYNAKAPNKSPFGDEEEPRKFLQFDVFTKLRVLHQLSIWTFWNPDRIRERMPEKKEGEQLQWRIEEFGYDREGRSYYVLDDNRLYRRTEPPIPAPQRPKKKAKARSRASRTSRRVSAAAAAAEEQSDNEAKTDTANGGSTENEWKWECLAVTLPEYQEFLETIAKSKDEDEVFLRKRIEEHVMPLLEKAEEANQRKRIKREKELLNMQMLAGAKRSSRLAQKEERERVEKEAADAARKREADLAEARREQAKQKQLEKERQSRMMTREQRTKDREQKRILHEAELERIAEEQEKAARGEGRVSARQLKAELEKSQKSLEELTQEDDWVFDCAGCGAYGENYDDGSHSVACEKCSVWQHSQCLGFGEEEAAKDDFHFICADCKRKEEEALLPKIPPLKFRVSSSASPHSTTTTPPTATKRKAEDEIVPSSPVKKTHLALANVQNAPSPNSSTQQAPAAAPPAAIQPSLPPLASQGQFYVPPSPERRFNPPHQTPLPSSSPPRQPFSPPKNNGYPSLSQQPQLGPGPNILPPMQHPHMQPGPQLPPIGAFGHVRTSSSHSASPVQNQPSMSPTQGNRDVGPLAGFPQTANSNGARQWPPSFDSHTPRPQSGHGAPPSMSSNYPSFSASATPNGNHHSSPPHSSHGMGMSGISPTKQSPRPMTSGNGMAGAPVLPPIRRLEPSPKLMGRSSPDAPIPPPIKCMTPEQEERRARENAFFNKNNGYAAHNQPHPMSSPSLNRIPPLGPAATQQLPEPIPSPQRGGDASRQ